MRAISSIIQSVWCEDISVIGSSTRDMIGCRVFSWSMHPRGCNSSFAAWLALLSASHFSVRTTPSFPHCIVCFTLYFILENQIVIYSLFGSAIGKILFMIWSSLKNPCYLDLNTENEESQSLINEEKRRKRKAGIICDDCGSRRPLRTYHCSKCYRCVIRYDHHSVLLNNCIGYGNQIQYGLFLLFSLLLDYIAWFVFVRYANFSSIFSDKKQIGYYLSSLVFVVVDTLNSISLSKLFMDNIVMNLTQYEADHYYRIGYLK